MYSFGFTERIKSKQEQLEEAFDMFDNEHQPDEAYFRSARYFFETYLSDKEIREIIDSKKYADLNTHSSNLLEHFKAIPAEMRDTILSYIKNNIEVERFA